ncbi:MAG: hypothetical protein NT062_11560 [Proteobacteria bacterium]|nr:hypothetical protein [Pseudomonadota bacterium]
MSQFVETRVGDFLGEGASDTVTVTSTQQPRALAPAASIASIAPRPSLAPKAPTAPVASKPAQESTARPAPAPAPMTSAAARFAIEPPPPIIKRPVETAAPKPAEKRPDQIFTF